MKALAVVLAILAPSKFCFGCNFAQAQLTAADFSSSVYVGANFEGAKLSGSSFHGARLIAANFHDADLRNASFDGTDCIACNFAGAQLDGASFSAAHMVAANFKAFAGEVADAQLRQLLSGCISCDFSSGKLANRDLSEIPLIAANFSQADLSGSNFSGAVLCWYAGNGIQRAPKCDTLAGATVAGANFQNAQLCDDPLARIGCTSLTAQALKNGTGSPLDGAKLPVR